MGAKFFPSKSLAELDRSCIWHPFTQHKTAMPPIPIVSGKGVYLYGEDGKSYLDAISSWWVNLHGHAHPYIAGKIKDQLDNLEHVIFADFTHRPAVELASRLLPLLPGGMERIFYTDNGSGAVEAALKICLQYWYNRNSSTEKTLVICFQNSYHGDTFGAMAASKYIFSQPFTKHLFEVVAIDVPYDGMEERSLQQLKAIGGKGCAACFIFEPLIQGVAGMKSYSRQGLDCLIRCCREYGILTIADEVMTGFGRTGPLFATEFLKETPDLICLSKGMTGGFLPLGAVACTEAIYEAFLSDNIASAFLHGHSYAGNPLGCVSALASLDLLLQEECSQQRKMIAAMHTAFCNKWKDHPALSRCESTGTIFALEYRKEASTDHASLKMRLGPFFLEHGLLLRPMGNVISVIPPYCIQKSELEWIYDMLIQTWER